MKTLFVCRSNAARSQMGEAWYNHLTSTKDGSSAGTAANDFVVVPQDVRLVMMAAEIEMPEAVPKQLTIEMAQGVGRIILMTDYAIPDFLIDNPLVTTWDVPDPRGDGPSLAETSDKIRQLIEENLL